MSLPAIMPPPGFTSIEARSFAIRENAAEIESVTQMPIGKSVGDGFEIANPRRLGGHWRRFLESSANAQWASYSEVGSLAVEFIDYIRSKLTAKDEMHQHISEPAFMAEVVLYCLRKVNTNKLKRGHYINERAKVMGALIELVPTINEEAHKAINRSIKYFANQRDQFSYLSDAQFAQFQADHAEMIRQIAPDVANAVLTEVKAVMGGLGNV